MRTPIQCIEIRALLSVCLPGQLQSSAAWTRDSPPKNPKDIRDFSIGLNGSLWNIKEPRWTIDLTPRLIRRINIVEHSQSNIAQLHGDVIILPIASAVKSLDNTYQFIPQFGVLNENRINSKNDAGVWRGGYTGFQSTVFLNGIRPRLSLKIQYQYFWDFAAPSGNVRRSDGYGKIALSYDLVDPDDKSLQVYPSISLAREVGINPVSGINQVNTTKLIIGFKIQTK
jgi:hypothetical protein